MFIAKVKVQRDGVGLGRREAAPLSRNPHAARDQLILYLYFCVFVFIVPDSTLELAVTRRNAHHTMPPAVPHHLLLVPLNVHLARGQAYITGLGSHSPRSLEVLKMSRHEGSGRQTWGMSLLER
jgi:hypothetical protein